MKGQRYVVTVLVCLATLFILVDSLQAQQDADQAFVTYVFKAIRNYKILPTTYPIFFPISDSLTVTACPGEYEPATFVVRALQEVRALEVTATELKSEEHTIPSSTVDIHVVKCWYQSGVEIWDNKQCILTPELLLKDDGLVRVDFENKANYLRTVDASGKESYILISGKDSGNMQDIQPQDTDMLQPVDITAGTNKQFWVTVHVPEDAAAGVYEGKIELNAANTPTVELILRLRVLPFALEKPSLRYSIYYRGRLNVIGVGSISSEGKSPEQYEAEMRDLHAHGVDYPTVYQGYNEVLLHQMFEIRERAGLPGGPLYAIGGGTGNPTSEAGLELLKSRVRKWVNFAGQYGYDEVYIYGIDEATGERLKSQRAAWSAVREVGGKVFVACYKGTFEVMGDLLNCAVVAGPPDPKEAIKYHSIGHQIFCYANPQVGMETPETYRRNFGLILWKGDYDGAMDYAYHHSMGHIWNDFDHERYRDLNFTYPTVNGIIRTIQWEGFREGVDDVRYMTTLLKTIEKAETNNPEMASEVQKWISTIDIHPFLLDLEPLRGEIINWILRLRTITISVENNSEPQSFTLSGNFPNPFNSSTVIEYVLPDETMVELTIFNATGQKVSTIKQGTEQAGKHSALWDASGLPSGIYFYRLKAGGFTETKKMLLLK